MAREKRHGVVVYAYQVADGFHYGHLQALKQAKELGDYLIVGVLTDKAVEAYKRRPISSLKERIEVIKHCDYVDEVVEQDDVDPTGNLKRIQPDIVVHGDDWDENFPGAEYMRSIGKQAIRTKYYGTLCTTEFIKEIQRRTAVGEL